MLKLVRRADVSAVGALLALSLFTSPSWSHVTLEQAQATAGSPYKAVLRIGHGCEGQPTREVVVRIPAGFVGARPMPKPGWTIQIRRAPLGAPEMLHGQTLTEDVAEVIWTARSQESWLADAHYDEFVLRGQLSPRAADMWFDVIQNCPNGQLAWDQRPQPNSGQRTTYPAAKLTVTPASAPAAAHAGHGHGH
jgi:periplasmic copper chaperone A